MSETTQKAEPKQKAAPQQRVRSVDINEDEGQRFRIEGYEEIPVQDIEAHPNNPRPTFHLDDDDPGLHALGESIKVDGQHRPAVVYELVGHYEEEDQPGKYRLYQGERRWRACKIANVETLRCLIAPTPQSAAEEWEWLGVEEAFKQDWQPYFVLKYCYELANKHGVPVYSSEISAKTGVSMSDLKVAEKLFKLEPPIRYYAAEYEELMYEQLVKGKRRPGTRLSGAGIRSKEFPVTKAALVYDVFEALRDNVPLLVKDKSDLELQQLVAQKATQGATVEDLQRLHGQIKQLGKKPPPGLLTEIEELLTNEERTVKDTIKATGAEHIAKVNRFMQRSPKLRKVVAGVVENFDQIGQDPDYLFEVHRETLVLIKDVGELERRLSSLLKEIDRENG